MKKPLFRSDNAQMFSCTDADASGKQGSGIYGGNTLWYGSYSECQKIHDSHYCWTMFPGSISLVPNKKQVKLYICYNLFRINHCLRRIKSSFAS